MPVRSPPALPEGGTFVRAEPLPEKAVAVTVPVTLIPALAVKRPVMVSPAFRTLVVSEILVRPEPLPEKAPAVTVPVVLIAVEPLIVPEVTAEPETLPAVLIVARLESGSAPVTCEVRSTLLVAVETVFQVLCAGVIGLASFKW